MHSQVLPFVARAGLLAALAAPAASGQPTVCRVTSDEGEHMLVIVRQYALATDSAWRDTRDSLHIPPASSASGVALVTRERTCRRANTAYAAAATGARQTLSGRVCVVRVGATYVVWDPTYVYNLASPAGAMMVFDSRWALKSMFMP